MLGLFIQKAEANDKRACASESQKTPKTWYFSKVEQFGCLNKNGKATKHVSISAKPLGLLGITRDCLYPQ
jgi:hypothetical protein